MTRPINERDRDEWYHNPVTQAFLLHLRQTQQETMETWGRGGFTGETPELTLQANINALGGLSVLRQTIELIEEAKAPLHEKLLSNDETESDED